MEGPTVVEDDATRQGNALDRDPSARRTQGHWPDLTGDSGMSRYKDLALRLVVVAAFVLTLAAPFRW